MIWGSSCAKCTNKKTIRAGRKDVHEGGRVQSEREKERANQETLKTKKEAETPEDAHPKP